jgi:protein phosphatase
LSEPLSDDAIATALADRTAPEDACAQLVQLALDAGGPDNITAIVARYRVS